MGGIGTGSIGLADGSLYGFEGIHEHSGSCEGTSQHIYNYAYVTLFIPILSGFSFNMANGEFLFEHLKIEDYIEIEY